MKAINSILVSALVSGGLLMGATSALAGTEKVINLSETAGYYDKKVIPANIRNECTELGSQFTASTKKFMEKGGYSVGLSPNMSKVEDGKFLKLTILTAQSGGNAFIGHRKSVSIEAELFKDGKLVDSYEATRNSGGGFAGGFKGSCSVLARCVTTLGKDVAKWMKKNDA